MADQSGEVRITRRYAGNKWQVPTATHQVFRLHRFQCHVLEMEDVHFRFDSAVLLPDPSDCHSDDLQTTTPDRITGLTVLRACFLHAKAHPDQSLLLAGHADTSGKPAYNQTLSEKRAQIVHAVLTGDRPAWIKIVSKQHKIADYQQILTWVAFEHGWGCDPGGIDGDRGQKTIAAIKAFQKTYNEKKLGKKIAVDGDVGDETWGAIFDVYMVALRNRLAAKTDAELADWRKHLRWLDPARPVVGCGENHPIEEPQRKDYRSQTNRRVELLFFDPANRPRLDCHPAKGGSTPELCEIYDLGCYQRIYIPCEPEITTRFAIQVVDENGKPLEGESYVIHQRGELLDEGVLNADGLAFFASADETKPFRLEVRGRVCAIEHGAVLQADSPLLQYGGAVLDWSVAETQMDFWSLYLQQDLTPARQQKDAGPSTFWQHDYITRREIKIRSAYLSDRTLRAKIRAIPVQIRTGPLLRHTAHDRAVIWVELETPGLVRVKVRRAGGAASGPAEVLHHGATVRVGGRYFAAVPIFQLEADTQYQYTLELAPFPAEGQVPKVGAFSDEVFPYKLPPPVLANIKAQLASCSLDGSEWISFRTLRRSYDDHLRFAHASCRKPHGLGVDSLEGLGKTLKATDRANWPRFMIHHGDQIYADDLSVSQGDAILVQRSAWTKPGPLTGEHLARGSYGGRFGTRIGPYRKTYAGEPSASVPPRLTIDNVLWRIPVEVDDLLLQDPTIQAGTGYERAHAADFAEFAFLYERAWVDPPAVRQLMAALPSFMIFDDHEITDDWNFDADWVSLVNESGELDAWPDTITDGLAAYWMYQGWGNLDPSEWDKHPLARILNEHRAMGTDALFDLRSAIAPTVEAPQEASESREMIWNYTLPITPLFVVLNGRTERVVGSSPKTSQMLTNGQFRWLHQQLAATDQAGRVAAFVVAAVPVLMPPAVAYGEALEMLDESGIQDNLGHLIVDHAERRGTDVEHWFADASWPKMRGLVASLSQGRQALKSIVFLSGDVHFSYNVLARLAGDDARPFPEMLQLVSSALQNEIGYVRTFKIRRLSEPGDALSAREQAGIGVRDRLKMALVRWLSNPGSPVKKNFLGVDLIVGGMRGVDDLRQTLLVDNSVAVVDAWFTPGGAANQPGDLVLRELILVGGKGEIDPVQTRPTILKDNFGAPSPGKSFFGGGPIEFWYETVEGGSAMTMPPFIGSGR